MKKRNDKKAFSLIELLFVIVLIGLLTAISVSQLAGVSDQIAFDNTYQEMLLIRSALIGDLDSTKQGFRDSFGYLGDVGTVPTSAQGLAALLSQPSGISAYAINTTAKIGIGWKGPYLKSTIGVDWTKDQWNRDYVYGVTSGTYYLKSYGADGVAGGSGFNADIQLDLDPDNVTGSVHGVLNVNGVEFSSAATLKLYLANSSGALTSMTTSIAPSNKGYFSFSSVPFGMKSLLVTLPSDSIGPAIFSVDKPNYLIHHSYLDSAPGGMEHVCSNRSPVSYIAGTYLRLETGSADDKKRIYFALSITESMAIDSFFLQTSKGDDRFRSIRLGQDYLTCANPQFEGCDHYDATGKVNLNDLPEMVFHGQYTPPGGVASDTWVIPAAARVDGYISLEHYNDADWIDLRLGCNVVRIQP